MTKKDSHWTTSLQTYSGPSLRICWSTECQCASANEIITRHAEHRRNSTTTGNLLCLKARCGCASAYIVGLKATSEKQMMHQDTNICQIDPGNHLAASLGPLNNASFASFLGPTLGHVPKLTTQSATPWVELRRMALRHACVDAPLTNA